MKNDLKVVIEVAVIDKKRDLNTIKDNEFKKLSDFTKEEFNELKKGLAYQIYESFTKK